MFSRMAAITVGFALTAVPGAAQTEHQHDHPQEVESKDEQNSVMQEMMMACPFLNAMGMSTDMMDMMGSGMMEPEMNGGMAGHRPGKAGRGMMGTGFPLPHQLIAQKDQLNLSEEQVAKLHALQDRVLRAVRVQLNMSRSSQRGAAEVLEQDPLGFDEYSEEIRSAGTHMVEAHIVMIQAGFEAQKILSPEQKKATAPISTDLQQSMMIGGVGTDTKIMKGRLVGGSGGS